MSPAAVQQFELLLGQFGGPRERERWQQLRQRVHVLGSAPGSNPREGSSGDCVEQREEGHGLEGACASSRIGADGAGCQALSMTSRVAALEKVRGWGGAACEEARGLPWGLAMLRFQGNNSHGVHGVV